MRPIAMTLLCVLTAGLRSYAYGTLRAAANVHRQLAHNFPNGAVAVFDRDLRFVLIDGNELSAIGLSREHFEGKTVVEAFDPDVAAGIEPHYLATLAGQETTIDVAYGDRLYETHTAPIRDENGVIIGGVVTAQNVTEARRAQYSDAFLAAIVEGSEDAIFTKDRNAIITSWNQGAAELYGYAPEEAINQHLSIIIPEDRRDEAERLLMISLSGQRLSHFETIRRRKDGELVHVSLTLSPLFAEDGTVVGVSAIARDITLRKQQQEAIEHLAYHDALTGLPNRRLAKDRLERAIAYARRYGGAVAVLAIDLDGFKTVNDLHGHAAGDAVLKAAADRLSATLRESDTAARMGGDEFLIILTGVGDEVGEAARARVETALADPVPYKGMRLSCPASVGLAVFERDGENAEALLLAADRAMYRQKATRRILR